MSGDHGWRGSGRFRVARSDGVLILQFANVWTKRTRLKDDIGAFFRKHYRAGRPAYETYAVRIWIETTRLRRQIDADNVAKACLDALTGIIWRDDSQVISLRVEKISSETDSVTLAVSEAKSRSESGELRRLLERAEALP